MKLILKRTRYFSQLVESILVIKAVWETVVISSGRRLKGINEGNLERHVRGRICQCVRERAWDVELI